MLHSVLFIGVGVNGAVPSPLSMSFRTGMIVCPPRVWVSRSSPQYSLIHWSWASLGRTWKAIWTSCFFVEVAKFYLMTISNVSCCLCLICLFPLDFHLSRYLLNKPVLQAPWRLFTVDSHKTTKTAPKTYIQATVYRLMILYLCI